MTVLYHVANGPHTVVRVCTWDTENDIFRKIGGGWSIETDEVRFGDYEVIKVESESEQWEG